MRDVRDVRVLLRALIEDERGGEVLEYALLAGLIIVAAVAAIQTVGVKINRRWSSLHRSF